MVAAGSCWLTCGGVAASSAEEAVRVSARRDMGRYETAVAGERSAVERSLLSG